MTLDELAADPARWPLLLELVRSEQVPAKRINDLCADNRKFAEWWNDRLDEWWAQQ